MGYLVSAAAAVLPVSHRERFRAEWAAELDAIRSDRGGRAAAEYQRQLFGASFRMTRELRAENSTAYAELSLASLSAMPATMVLAAWALLDGRWSIVVAQLAIAIGIVLVAIGFWTRDGRVLDSISSRVGLLMVLVGSVVGTLAIQFDGFSPLASQRIDIAIPNTAIIIGLAILAISNYAVRYRRRLQVASLYVLAPASIVLGCVAVVNAMHLSGASRFIVLVYALPAVVLAWACYSILGRAQVAAAGDER